MHFADTVWLRATATQRGWSHVMNYGAAFYGNAMLQSWKLGIEAPMVFWTAMARASDVSHASVVAPAAVTEKPVARSAPKVVAEAPSPSPKSTKSDAALQPKAVKAAPVKPAEIAPEPSAKVAASKPAQPKAVKEAAPVKLAEVASAKVAPKPAKPAAPKATKVAAPKPAAKAPEPAREVNKNPHLLDAPRGGKADDLTVMSGVGEKLALVMNDFGIFHFDQIAGLTDHGIDWLNAQQPGFKAVIKRFDLVGQAKALA